MKTFYDAVRAKLFRGRLSPEQFEGIQLILGECAAWGVSDAQTAYILATAYHETAHLMEPVVETRTARDKTNPSVDAAIKRLENSFKAGKLTWVKTPYWRKDAQGKSWLGRGFVQLTHKSNYQRASAMVDRDLVAKPELALEPDISATVLVGGMVEGLFTGIKLSDMINDSGQYSLREQFVRARRIVNGNDKSAAIANYAMVFYDALVGAAAAGDGVASQYAPAPEKIPTPSWRPVDEPDDAVLVDDLHINNVITRAVQEKLHKLGYNTGSLQADGKFDGVYGNLTRAAILASKDENGYTPLDVKITLRYLKELDHFAPRKLVRNTQTDEDVMARVPEAATNRFQKLVGLATAAIAAVTSTVKQTADSLGVPVSAAVSWLASVPLWVWTALAVALGVALYRQGKRGEEAAIETFKRAGR